MSRLAIGLCLLVIALFAASLLIGPAGTGPGESLAALFAGDGGPLTLVMREIRLPRAILAVMIGASLGLAGAAMQGYLRNPLAEPGLIGVSGSAALGAVLALQTGLAAAFALALPLSALLGALIGVGLVMALAGPRGRSLTLILAGIADIGAGGGADIAGAEPVAQPVRRQRNRVLDDGLAGGPLVYACLAGAAAHGAGLGCCCAVLGAGSMR